MTTTKNFLTREQAAEILGVTPGTLANWYTRGHGPRFKRPQGSRRALYSLDDIQTWIDSNGAKASVGDKRTYH